MYVIQYCTLYHLSKSTNFLVQNSTISCWFQKYWHPCSNATSTILSIPLKIFIFVTVVHVCGHYCVEMSIHGDILTSGQCSVGVLLLFCYYKEKILLAIKKIIYVSGRGSSLSRNHNLVFILYT